MNGLLFVPWPQPLFSTVSEPWFSTHVTGCQQRQHSALVLVLRGISGYADQLVMPAVTQHS